MSHPALTARWRWRPSRPARVGRSGAAHSAAVSPGSARRRRGRRSRGGPLPRLHPAPAGTQAPGASAGVPMSLRLAARCDIAVGVTMGHLLILMIA
jgi:hypothetical protein